MNEKSRQEDGPGLFGALARTPSWTENADEIDRLRASNAELIAALVVAFEAMDRMRECAEGKHVGSESEICYQLNLAQEIVQAELAKVQP